ncbi:unnamed protein product [Clonostachys rosea]|uniref:BZIP domain-containing protein n=1 Tax=Bionectria ochroleuca TaxID=29856 RepID=A0ABY6TYC2_BIOOC|nr:unnamed protein product [Clonostachys rosea]
MNWTEGALARHSRRRGWNEDAARQKQYFAKARAHQCQRSVLTNTSEGVNSNFIPDHIPQTPKSALINPRIASISQTSSQKSRRRARRPSNECRKMAPETFESPFFEMGRKRARDSPVAKSLSPNPPPPDIESKRRRLLEKRDWTGVEVQKPLIVDFSHPRPENLFSHQRKGAYRGHGSSAYKADDPMKIRIGAHNLEWSHGNNSLLTPSLTSELLPSLQDWDSLGSCTPVHVPSSPSHSSLGMCTSPSVQANILPPNCHIQGTSYDVGSLLGQDTNCQSMDGCGGDEPKYKVQSTPREFHHPQPSRGERPRLFDLRSPEPEPPGSMIVELGGPVPYQNLDEEEEWRNWLHSIDDFSVDQNFILDGEYQLSSTLTPGISEG